MDKSERAAGCKGDKKGQRGINGDIRGERPVLYYKMTKPFGEKDDTLRAAFKVCGRKMAAHCNVERTNLCAAAHLHP